jgi:hypothetical protein
MILKIDLEISLQGITLKIIAKIITLSMDLGFIDFFYTLQKIYGLVIIGIPGKVLVQKQF